MKTKFYTNFYLIIAALIVLSSCDNNPVDIIQKRIHSVNDIEVIDTSMVKPYDYTSVISLGNLPVAEKKQKYIDMVLPAILVAKLNLLNSQNKVKTLISKDTSEISKKQKTHLQELLKKYKAKNFDELLSRLNTHPNSIVIAQSAIESGWGTSRFFLEANNLFGVWSFNKSDDRIKAKSDREGKSTYLKKYKSLSGSIEDYFLTIGRGPYKDFRFQRIKTNNPYILVTYLLSYSELREEYVKHLQQIIKRNDLTKYDNYQIDPKYLNNENLSIKIIEEKFEFEFEEELNNDQRQDTIENDTTEKITSLVEKAKVQFEKPSEVVSTATNNKIDSDLPDFANIKNVEDKKRQFFSFMRPKVIIENNRVLSERDYVFKMQTRYNEKKEITNDDTIILEELATKYRIKNKDFSKAKSYKNLLLHIDIIPLELALTQAALESAWGTSYFARELNNIYGQWCFTPGCGVVPKRRPKGETHEVAIFDDVSQSVRYYMGFLNSHPVFDKLRKTRFKNRKNDEEPNSYDMAGGLSSYSARGNDYISELRNMIMSNKKYMGIK